MSSKMGTKKKDLEIIYSLVWKDKSANGGDKANIIGMYDIPATTLNWEIFKSYLLKNSGAVGEDVNVSYITDSNREFPIDSQTDFQIALYAFRRKARMGEIVNLKLERAGGHDPVKPSSRNSNDVETQVDNNESVSLVSTCCNAETPPEWFIMFMNQFKKDVKEEIAKTVTGMLSNLKPHVPPQPSYHSRKSKSDNPKRMRKLQPHNADVSHETKDLLKSLKLEGKLERKLEKLEHKSQKIRVKKLALFAKSSDSEAGQSSSKSHSRKDEIDNNVLQMDASPVISQSIIPHMLGGEIYLHQWKVVNTGSLPWTVETTLNFTWGSKALKPLDTIIPVPHLLPNEMDTISVRLQIPEEPGQYECYWHFHHNGRRFGHWLGCQVIVDPFDLKGNKSVLETSFTIPFEQSVKNGSPVTNYSDGTTGIHGTRQEKYEIFNKESNESENNFQNSSNSMQIIVRNISRHLEDMKLQDPTDTNCSSDSDNQSIVSLNEVIYPKGLPEEFVPIPDCFKVDNIPNKEVPANLLDLNMSDSLKSQDLLKRNSIQKHAENSCDDNNNGQNCQITAPSDDVLSNYSQKTDIVLVSLNDDSDVGEDYAYVLVEGRKSPVPVPKKIIKTEYLENNEKIVKTRENTLSRASSSGSSVEIVNKSDLTTDCGSTSTPIKPTPVGLINQQTQVMPEPVKETPFQTQSELLVDLDQSVVQQVKVENNELPSHCSATGTCFSETMTSLQANSRVFVFPEDCPGYEILSNSTTLPNSLNEMQRGDHLAEQIPTTISNRSTHPLNLTTHDRNPFSQPRLSHVPNFQQTPPENRQAPEYVPIYPDPATGESAFIQNTESVAAEFNSATFTPSPETIRERRPDNPVHILPETLVTGAVNVASSAINTARSVINMIRPQETPRSNGVLQQPGTWVNGRWVSTNQETLREANLQALAEMGFWNRDLNATLLARFNDDLARVVGELVQ